ncbi:MAG: fatty acid desaturase [Myxococcaceae bacterium]|nr:fatty acid desaturase [Myxococcaceae bacterium]
MFAANRPLQLAHVTAIVALPPVAVVSAIALAVDQAPCVTAVLCALVLHALSMVGIELGFHRGLSHRAFEAKGWVWQALVALGGLAAQGPGLYWAALHRHHHAHSDAPGDPHSPNLAPGLRGLLRGHLGWMFEPPPEMMFSLIADLRSEKGLRRADALYPLWALGGLVGPAALCFAIHGTGRAALEGLLWSGVRLFLVQHGIWSINSITHRYGRRPFDSRDASTDLGALSLATLGGSLHNTHHAFPFTADNALAPGTIDPGHWCLKLLEKLGLVSALKVPAADAVARLRR